MGEFNVAVSLLYIFFLQSYNVPMFTELLGRPAGIFFVILLILSSLCWYNASKEATTTSYMSLSLYFNFWKLMSFEIDTAFLNNKGLYAHY
jgi:hypothetical protein